MQHETNIIFDQSFNEAQLKRHAASFSSDIIVRNTSDIILEEINLLKEVHKRSFAKVGAINFFPSAPIAHEEFDCAHKYDLIISNLVLHHENDLIKTLKSYKQSLNENGVLLATMFGGSTLKELRRILEKTELELKGGVSPRVIPMIDVKDAGRLMQMAKFSQVVATIDEIVVMYKNFRDMINHPRKIGQSNCMHLRNKLYLGKNFLKAAGTHAQVYFGEEDFSSSFDIISLTGANTSPLFSS
jgi:SAM-dependent methyltransferase